MKNFRNVAFLLVLALCFITLSGYQTVYAQTGYLGEIRMFAGNFAPNGWMLCQGQILSIQQNTALFSIIGTMYGGNGTNNFALPNLSSRVPVGTGTGTGMSTRTLGDVGGEETSTLTIQQLPAHNHTIYVNSSVGTTENPANMYFSRNAAGIPEYSSTTTTTTMGPSAVSIVGGNQAHNNMQPFIAINYIICVNGTYPVQ
jgi:microcystin-dependent protein